MRIEPLDVETAPEELLRRWHDCSTAAAVVDDPQVPPPSYPVAVSWQHRDEIGPKRAWLALDGDEVVGGALLALFEGGNEHTCELEVTVHPQRRRSGVGRALTQAAATAARADGRRLMIGSGLQGSAGEAFALAAGAEVEQVARRSLLVVADLDRDVVAAAAARRPEGYDVVGWSGPCPPEHAEGLARLKAAMATAPLGGLEIEAFRWDADRVRDSDAGLAARGMRRHVTCARHRDTGELVALTDLWTYDGDASFAEQDDTVVLPAHRGHGLGLLVKALNLQRLLEHCPSVERIETWNADENTHMLAVNTALGFRALDLWSELQAEVPTVLRWSTPSRAEGARTG